MVPLQAHFKGDPIHRRLHILSLASLLITLAFLIYLSVSNIDSSSRTAFELALAEFTAGASPNKLVDGSSGETVAEGLRYIHYGLWNYCWETIASFQVSCSKSGLGYSHTIVRTDEFPISLTISSNLTRAFVLHPIAAVVALFALLPTIYLRTAFKGYTVVLSTVSMVMVLATLAVDIAFVSINSAKFDANPSLYVWVYFSLGFWPMIVPTLFSIIACVVISVQYWKGRHVKAVDFAEADYPMSPTAAANEEPGFDNGPWWRRFKWAGASTASVNRSQATSVIGEQPTDRSM